MPVVPLIVYHGKKSWEHKRFDEYFEGMDKDLAQFLPKFDYLLTDLSCFSDEEIVQLFERVSVQIGLRIMKNIFHAKLLEQKMSNIFQKLDQLFQTDSGRELFVSMMHYLMSNADKGKEKIIKTINEISEKGGELIMTIAMQWKQEGKIEGKIDNQKELVLRFFVDKGFTIEEVADLLEVEEDFVRETLKEKGLLD